MASTSTGVKILWLPNPSASNWESEDPAPKGKCWDATFQEPSTASSQPDQNRWSSCAPSVRWEASEDKINNVPFKNHQFLFVFVPFEFINY
jgi:hypothetical protein